MICLWKVEGRKEGEDPDGRRGAEVASGVFLRLVSLWWELRAPRLTFNSRILFLEWQEFSTKNNR
jgi:hypothetical protein